MTTRLWGGRFRQPTDPRMDAFGRSLHLDARLAPFDLAVCRAHVTMLTEAGVVQGQPLIRALQAMESELAAGTLVVSGNEEDVHSWVEAELARRVGPEASNLRIGRSRNDLVVTDFRLWTMDACSRLLSRTRQLQKALLEQAERHPAAYLPGYTHLQRAQPVLLSHHLLAHFWALERDASRWKAVRSEADCCTLGAGALAGSSWPMNPSRTAELLGFSRVFENSLDAVADRDFAVSFLSAASLSMVHLSRLSEELVLWSGTEFGYLELHDSWSTGSSLMPQKRNPDAAELTRGRAGRVVGDLMNLLMQLKGLPLTYNRDLQEDKPAAFDAFDTLDACLDVLAGMISACSFRVDRMAEAAQDPALLATDLADALVRAGHPFSVAHELAGKAQVGGLSAEEQAEVGPLLASVTVESALANRSHPGAAGPRAVATQMDRARAALQ